MDTLYVIERRHADGSIDLRDPQPESVFGPAAIHGISELWMARVIWQHRPEAVLTGDTISTWPSKVHPNWVARRKTW